MSTIEQRFGPYGGRYVPETLIAALDELTEAWADARDDPAFNERLRLLHRDFIGRPTPLYLADRLSARAGRRVYLKREDLAHTGAHKINNAIGQALLAERMGKPRVIAETGAGQHGVATATACALFGLECVVYMGSEDIRRQRPNVERMGLLGAEVVPVEAGARTLKEAVSAAIRDWVANVETTHYVIGSAVGPAPFPALVRDLQRVIGEEARVQALAAEGALPARVIADYPGVGPEHAFLRDSGRASYFSVTDAQALAAFAELCRLEGIIPALESSHAIAWLLENGGGGDGYDVLCLSGRGDKDLAEVLEQQGVAKGARG
jgi:tryptophan synthase beta chain